jgi:DNA-binding transcriptional regulator YhcF (GntR family)
VIADTPGRSRDIAPGSFLRSLRMLTEKHPVSRMIAERAAGQLRAAGLVRGIPASKGVYVRPESERGGA